MRRNIGQRLARLETELHNRTGVRRHDGPIVIGDEFGRVIEHVYGDRPSRADYPEFATVADAIAYVYGQQPE